MYKACSVAGRCKIFESRAVSPIPPALSGYRGGGRSMERPYRLKESLRIPLSIPQFCFSVLTVYYTCIMNLSGKVPHTIDRLKELLRRLLSLYLDNAKLTVAEKLTLLFSAGVVLLVCLVLGLFGLAFISGACIELLALMLPAWASYLIMGGVFLLLVICVILFKNKLVVDPISRFISRLVFDDHHEK